MTEPASIRIVLCDDHAIVRDGLARVIDTADGLEVVGTASDGMAGVETTLRLRPDVVVMDLVMPRLDGVEATRRIVADAPETTVIALTSFADAAHVVEAIDAGARGFLLKDAPVDELVRAIRSAASGDAPLDPRAARAVLARKPSDDPRSVLSAREGEVLELVANGLRSAAIARRLGIAEPTVRAHLTNIYRRIGVTDRTQAAIWARERGLGTP